MFIDKYDWLVYMGMASSKSEARRLVMQGAVKLDGRKIVPEAELWFDPQIWAIQWELELIDTLRGMDKASRSATLLANLSNPDLDTRTKKTLIQLVEDVENDTRRGIGNPGADRQTGADDLGQS